MIAKKIVGYTAGAFDMFHIGHLNLIRNAKGLCDYLIVGVTTDELIFEMKGKKPIIPFDERVEVLQSIKEVNAVVPQRTINKIDAWEKFKFDVMFSGDDWKGTERWNDIENELNKVGTSLVYFPYTRTTSSTKISKIINEIILLP